MQSTFDHIVRGHRIVQEATARILDSTDLEEVGRQLEGLAEVLPDHFSYEERPGGYFDHLRDHLPDGTSKRLAQLTHDHRFMEGELQDLLEEGARGDPSWLEWAHRFARHLREHEAAEAGLGAAAESGSE